MEKRFEELTHFGIRPGFERIQFLLQQFGNPHQKYPCVHIAGTNGKGTVTQIISQALADAGYRVGKFTSPHLHDYTERLQINGEPISYEEMNRYFDQIEAWIPQMQEKGLAHPTEFEVLTAMAFLYFCDKKVDIAVLEVGMGGTWDSTNVITPCVSVITGIAYDHMTILGSTLAEIAENKAGIIKEGVPVVIGEMPDEAATVIYRTAEQRKSSVIRSATCEITVKNIHPLGQTIQIQGAFPELACEDLAYHLLGTYQRRNLATALTALWVLAGQGYGITPKSLRKTLAGVSLPGRLEIVSQKPLVFVDVAHNPQGAEALAESLQELFPEKNKILICAILDDKDAETMLKYLSIGTRKVIFTRPLGPRGKQWRRLLQLWKNLYPAIPAVEEEDIAHAIQKACLELKDAEYLLITGSFYLMDPARKYFI